MKQIEIGDYVSLKKGLKHGKEYGKETFYDYMKFKGEIAVRDTYVSGMIELSNDCAYSPEMLIKKQTSKAMKTTIFIDDAWHSVNIDNEDLTCLHMYELEDILRILLTEKQQNQFSGGDQWEFEVSLDRVRKAKKYLSDNHWRDDKKRSDEWYAKRLSNQK